MVDNGLTQLLLTLKVIKHMTKLWAL